MTAVDQRFTQEALKLAQQFSIDWEEAKRTGDVLLALKVRRRFEQQLKKLVLEPHAKYTCDCDCN